MKLLRYLLNTILFVVLWCVMFLPVMKFSIDTGGTSIAAIGGIVAIIISYSLVKRINKSNLWASLFDKTEVINEVVEDKKVEVEKKGSYNWNLISIVALVLVVIILVFNAFFFPKINTDLQKCDSLRSVEETYIHNIYGDNAHSWCNSSIEEELTYSLDLKFIEGNLYYKAIYSSPKGDIKKTIWWCDGPIEWIKRGMDINNDYWNKETWQWKVELFDNEEFVLESFIINKFKYENNKVVANGKIVMSSNLFKKISCKYRGDESNGVKVYEKNSSKVKGAPEWIKIH